MKLERFSEPVQRALKGAESYARDLGHGRVMPAHVLVALLANGNGIVLQILAELGADAGGIEKRVHRELSRLRIPLHGSPTWDASLRELMQKVDYRVLREETGLIEPQDMLLEIAHSGPGIGKRSLNEAGVTRPAIQHVLRRLGAEPAAAPAGASPALPRPGATPQGDTTSRPGASPMAGSTPALTPGSTPSSTPAAGAASGATPGSAAARRAPAPSPSTPDTEQDSMLEKFGRDLTAMARSGELDPIIGRDVEIRRLMQILGRRSKNNPILIGEPGVGKTAIVEGFAYRLINDEVPFGLKGKRLVEIDMAALVAGTSLRGQFEERVKRLVGEVAASNGQIILYIDEVHSLVAAGGRGGSGGAADMLKPALARGEITIIGTTTPAEYRSHIEPDKALERRFQDVYIDEPDEVASIAILRGIKERYEIHHRVRILDSAVQAAVRLSERYVLERKLPDKAIDLIDEAASRLRMQVDSEPAEVSALKQRVAGLELQRAAMVSEPGAESSPAVRALDVELATLNAELGVINTRLEHEKALLDRISELKAELEASRKLADQARADGDLGRSAELKYSVIRHLEEELAAQNAELDGLHDANRMVREEVGEEDIAQVVGDWTGVPMTKLLEGERQKLLAFGDRLSERVIGQPQAVEAIAAAVRRSRAGLQERDRPIGNFFFVGPTGVGKTELAKALAEALFDSEDAIIRIDMSEYMEQSKVNSLIGAAYGYVDSDKGGILTEAVRRRPYSVVLFDEAEKAHPDIFNILLQVLDEGRLTDSQGRRVDFTNTIIIMTSNVGAREILDLTGRIPYEELDEKVHLILRDHFKPEFLNRLDDTVVFNALDRPSMEKIAAILVRKLKKLLAEQELRIEFTDAALQHVIDVGFQPEYGARPLKRALLTEVQDPLSTLVLEGRFGPGDTIHAELAPEGGKLVFKGG